MILTMISVVDGVDALVAPSSVVLPAVLQPDAVSLVVGSGCASVRSSSATFVACSHSCQHTIALVVGCSAFSIIENIDGYRSPSCSIGRLFGFPAAGPLTLALVARCDLSAVRDINAGDVCPPGTVARPALLGGGATACDDPPRRCLALGRRDPK